MDNTGSGKDTRKGPEDADRSGTDLSEEGFRKSNVPAGGQAPPLQGTVLEIDGTRCYLSLPPGAVAPLPGIVVIHEWWGLNDHIRRWSDRLAADGCAALAVDLYGGKVAASPDSAMAYRNQIDDARAMEILEAAARRLRQDPRVLAPKVGVIGWCFGGGYALKLALADPTLDATVMYYGRVVSDPEQLASIHGPLLGIFANQDKNITPQVVNEFNAALAKAGVGHTILRYDANHAFANPSGASYNGEAAADAWSHVRRFLAENLKK